MGNKKNKVRRSKRRFYRNQFTTSEEGESDLTQVHRPTEVASQSPSTAQLSKRPLLVDTPVSRSSKKIRLEDMQITESDCSHGFVFFMHFSVLQDLICKIGSCPLCKSGLFPVHHSESKKMGLSVCFKIECASCRWSHEFFSSPVVLKENTPGPNCFIVNLQTVMAMREIGQGHESLKTFTTCMGMPNSMTKNTFSSINDKLLDAYEKVSQACMKQAAEEVRKTALNENAVIEDCQVAIDGTWQKRGHSSLNGVVVATTKGAKVIDCQVFTKYCKGCQIWSRKEGTDAHVQWKRGHVCKINHQKSSGAMEADGAVAIFHRSIEKYKLRYIDFIGDGDTGSFLKVCESKPYGDLLPKKLECVGHVQKRLGTRLRKLRSDYRGKCLGDGKKIMGKGRLTDKNINTLQTYYGMAIRQNTSNVYAMKKAIEAVLFHCTDIEDEVIRHQFCPRSENSWCNWQKDRANGTCLYKKKINLPVEIKSLIEPIFRDLSTNELLNKCLHGQTQNANEAFNAVLWQKCPKEIFVGRDTLEIASYSAIINYNEGFYKIKDVFAQLGIPVNKYFLHEAIAKDKQRVNLSAIKSSDFGRNRRKRLRAIKKGFLDKERDKEDGESYSAGSF